MEVRMNRSTIAGVTAGAIAATALGALASYKFAGGEAQSDGLPSDSLQSDIALTAQPQAPPVAAAKLQVEQPRIRQPQFADVLAVTPVTETIQTPKEECHDEVVTHTAPVKDTNQIAGTIAGAVVGGVVGNQFGAGSGKKVTTVAGAVAGGYAGNKIQEKMQAADTYTTTERRCTTVTETKEQVLGYDVTYRWNGQDRVARMDQAPGTRIAIRDGRPVTDVSPTKS